MTRTLGMLLAVVGSLAAATAFALEGESIVFNPRTGNYLITYHSSEDDSFHQVVFVPATKIVPTLKSHLNSDGKGTIHYRYTLISGQGSQQSIVQLILDPVSSVKTPLPDVPLDTPPVRAPVDSLKVVQITDQMWNSAKYFDTPSQWQASMAYSKGQKTFGISWYYDSDAGGLPPASKALFGFNSRDLPGIIEVAISGFAPNSQDIPGEEGQDPNDGGFGQQYTDLISNNFVPCPAAVPAIAVPNPFNAATLLNSIQTQMHGWIAMNLLDATFSTQLDRSLAAAINAYGHNQPKASKENIEELRRMLRREHANLDSENESTEKKDSDAKHAQIALLAARVLDFDLNYVLQRMEQGRDRN
jgi:hypothetical protein